MPKDKVKRKHADSYNNGVDGSIKIFGRVPIPLDEKRFIVVVLHEMKNAGKKTFRDGTPATEQGVRSKMAVPGFLGAAFGVQAIARAYAVSPVDDL